jgi:hypothetical protein
VLIGDHLGLDVARFVQVALDEALAAPERGDGLAGGRLEELGNLLDRAGDLHPAAAAAERGLDRHRNAVFAGERHHLVGVLHRIGGARHQGGLRACGDVAGGHLVAEVADGLRARADPDQPGVDDGLGEIGVLREEAVAGMDRVRAGLGRGVEDLAEVPPRAKASSASRTCGASASGSAYTATLARPASLAARITRTAISPRLATRTLEMVGTAPPAGDSKNRL